MKILVMGAGAIGCLVGGHMAASGHEVTLIGRPPLVAAVAANGLTLHWPERPAVQSRPKTNTTTADLTPPYDFIFLTVKAPATSQAVAEVAPLIDDTPAILVSMQNGIGNEEQAAMVVGAGKVMAGTVTVPVQMPEPGLVEVSKAGGGLGLAPLHPGQPVTCLAEALCQAGLTTMVYSDYRSVKWSKLIVNIATNATSAILNQGPAEVITRTELFNLEIDAIREALKVMQALGVRPVKLPGYPIDRLARLARLPYPFVRHFLRPVLACGRGRKMPSLLTDLAAGRTVSEIEVLNGAIVRAGQRLGINTPVNQALTEILSGLFRGDLAWADYQGQPQRLLQAVAKCRHCQGM
jgi:2-dehydropantoate 2-reductase